MSEIAMNSSFIGSYTCLKHPFHDAHGVQNIIYLSSCKPPQPKNDLMSQTKSEKFLRSLGIKSILNVAIDCLSMKHHRQLYQKMEIDHREHLIKDDTINGFQDDYLEQCLEFFFNFPSNGAVLIHCAAGQNRSAAAAAAILWVTTGNYGVDRPWKTPEKMIEWMRRKQETARKCRLLKNPVFYQQVVNWCRRYDEIN